MHSLSTMDQISDSNDEALASPRVTTADDEDDELLQADNSPPHTSGKNNFAVTNSCKSLIQVMIPRAQVTPDDISDTADRTVDTIIRQSQSKGGKALYEIEYRSGRRDTVSIIFL